MPGPLGNNKAATESITKPLHRKCKQAAQIRDTLHTQALLTSRRPPAFHSPCTSLPWEAKMGHRHPPGQAAGNQPLWEMQAGLVNLAAGSAWRRRPRGEREREDKAGTPGMQRDPRHTSPDFPSREDERHRHTGWSEQHFLRLPIVPQSLYLVAQSSTSSADRSQFRKWNQEFQQKRISKPLTSVSRPKR